MHVFVKLWLMLLVMLCVVHVQAQETKDDDTTGIAYTKVLMKAYPVKNERFLSALKEKTDDKKLYKYYTTRYKAIFEAVNETIKDGSMVQIPELTTAIDEILTEIKSKNSGLPNDLQVMLIRENIPNAYTLGDNTIFIHLGLLYYVENEHQLACILAHEIGHLLLNHSLLAITDRYDRDKKSVEDAKIVREKEVGRADHALALLKSSIYEGGKMARKHELQADSIGYAIVKNTKYRASALLRALELIERNDTLIYNGLKTETYKQYFDVPNQKFNDKWLESEDFSAYNYNSYKPKFDEDSLSSHPKSEARIKYLKSVFPELSKGLVAADTEMTPTYEPVRTMAEQQLFPNMKFNEEYGKAIYISLILLQEQPDNEYYKEQLGKNLQKIYEARRDYRLNKFLDRVSPKDQSKNYVRYLNFMWNLKPEELKNLSDYYAALESRGQ